MGKVNTADKLMERYVEKTSDCWLWTGSIASNGYSKTTVNYRTLSAHRFLYEYFVGPIPTGMHIDHLCRNRACVNPAHLEVVTCKENMNRGIGPGAINSRKVMCIHGHPLSGANLYMTPDNRRQCRTCLNARSRRSADRR